MKIKLNDLKAVVSAKFFEAKNPTTLLRSFEGFYPPFIPSLQSLGVFWRSRIKIFFIVYILFIPSATWCMDHDIELAEIRSRSNSSTPLTNSAEILRSSKEEKIASHEKQKTSLWKKIICCICLPKMSEHVT